MRWDLFCAWFGLSAGAVLMSVGYRAFVVYEAYSAGNPAWREVETRGFDIVGMIGLACLASAVASWGSGLLRVNASDDLVDLSGVPAGEAVPLPCGGTVIPAETRLEGRVRCSAGHAHGPAEIVDAALAASARRALRLEPPQAAPSRWRPLRGALVAASPLALLGWLYSIAERPWGSKAPFFLQPAADSFGFGGISLGFYRFLGHDWSGVEFLFIAGLIVSFGALAYSRLFGR